MRSSASFALFAGAAAAQSMSTGSTGASSGVLVFDIFAASTLTLVGSDATATTYKNDCPASSDGVSILPSLLPSSAASQAASAAARITPAPKPRGLLARQATATDTEGDNYGPCEPYTIKQGASTWEIHLTDPSPGVLTVDMKCNWKGAMTAADFTCTAVNDGEFVDTSARGTISTTVSASEISGVGLFNTVKIVGASNTPLSSGAVPTASGSGASGSGASGAAAPAPSTGRAPAGPLPTGAMALVGGAAGAFAAALAL